MSGSKVNGLVNDQSTRIYAEIMNECPMTSDNYNRVMVHVTLFPYYLHQVATRGGGAEPPQGTAGIGSRELPRRFPQPRTRG